MSKKTLVIYPNEGYDCGFYIFDPETGEALASHFCSHHGFAKGDLHDDRPERIEEWKEKFGMETEAKFVNETDYVWDEIYAKNQKLGEEAAQRKAEEAKKEVKDEQTANP